MLARIILITGAAAMLTACGLAETGAAAGATGATAAEQAREAETITEEVKTDIAAAQEAAAEARRQAEAASE